MRKAFLFSLFILISYSGIGQEQIFKKILFWFDYPLIISLTDSLKSKGINTFFIYQKQFDTIKYKNKLFDSVDDNVVSYLGWLEKDRIKIILITENYISKPQYISDTIFYYKFIDRIWINNDDKHLNSLGPNVGYNKIIYIQVQKNNERFFEFGEHNLTYNLDVNKAKYRIQFLKILENELLNVDNNWEVSQFFDRTKDWKEVK